jgi:ribosomal protein S18 acetylase RimI-like enzyme
MAVISKPLTLSPADSHLRPFDARRDLQAVADLVELCFADTLDPDGRDYLVRMRSAAQSPPWLSWANTAEWATPAMAGYVWQEEDRLVGNVSIIPFLIKARRYFLIANVAVHPNYRKRGIGRLLTERAVQYTRQRGAPSAWLHVREENLSAVSMYQAQGFVERARRTSWLTNRETPNDEPLSGVKFVAPASRHWEQLRAWLSHSYPPELSWHLPFQLNLLRPGLVGEFYRFLYNAYIYHWSMLRGERLLGAVAWQPTGGHTNLVWLAVPPEGDPRVVQALLLYARQHAIQHRTLMLDFPARQYEMAIQAAGFYAQQTLIWMEKVFS